MSWIRFCPAVQAPYCILLSSKHVLSPTLAFQAPSGKKRYQVTLRSQTAPIQVLLINRETPSSRPVVFSVPPGDDASVLPTPPSTPASMQRFPLSSSYISSSYSSGCSQDSLCADHHQMALQDNALTPSSTPPDVQMGKSMGKSK